MHSYEMSGLFKKFIFSFMHFLEFFLICRKQFLGELTRLGFGMAASLWDVWVVNRLAYPLPGEACPPFFSHLLIDNFITLNDIENVYIHFERPNKIFISDSPIFSFWFLAHTLNFSFGLDISWSRKSHELKPYGLFFQSQALPVFYIFCVSQLFSFYDIFLILIVI